jgi:hypothetical protein
MPRFDKRTPATLIFRRFSRSYWLKLKLQTLHHRKYLLLILSKQGRQCTSPIHTIDLAYFRPRFTRRARCDALSAGSAVCQFLSIRKRNPPEGSFLLQDVRLLMTLRASGGGILLC